MKTEHPPITITSDMIVERWCPHCQTETMQRFPDLQRGGVVALV
jgi:hypothetical protein